MPDTGTSSGIPVLGAILDALGSLLGSASQVQDLSRSISQVEQAAWSNTINVAVWSFGLFGGVLDAIGSLAKTVAGALLHLVRDIIFGHLLALITAIRDFLKHLHDLIAPLVKELQTLQREYNKIVGQQMRRYLDLIQRIRRILVPFRLLHLGFAKKLDSYLVGLESDIGAKWAKLIAHQNQVLGVLNDIIDPRQLMRPGNTLGSLGQMIGAVHGAIAAADLRSLFCLGPAAPASPLVAPWSTTRARIFLEWRTSSGDYATFVAQRDQALAQYALDLGTDTIR